jgi:hypothetical protein
VFVDDDFFTPSYYFGTFSLSPPSEEDEFGKLLDSPQSSPSIPHDIQAKRGV